MISFKQFFFERAFHGSPNEVAGDFNLDYIGTGEGGQAFGWGLYFAENPKVAETYKNLHPYSQREVRYKGKTPREWEDVSDGNEQYVWEKIRLNVSKEDLLNYPLSKQQLDLVKSLPDELFHKGNMYEVDIDASIDDFIHYDGSESEYDPILKKINDGIKRFYHYDEGNYFQGTYDGKSLYPKVCKVVADFENNLEQFGSQPTKNEQILGSKFLAKVGVKGIRYLDELSRSSGQGTYNYVIFDPSIIKIVKTNGQFVMPSKKPESVEID
jgi:hypothetical protein